MSVLALAVNGVDTSFNYYGIVTSLCLWSNLCKSCTAIQFEIVWSTLFAVMQLSASAVGSNCLSGIIWLDHLSLKGCVGPPSAVPMVWEKSCICRVVHRVALGHQICPSLLSICLSEAYASH